MQHFCRYLHVYAMTLFFMSTHECSNTATFLSHMHTVNLLCKRFLSMHYKFNSPAIFLSTHTLRCCKRIHTVTLLLFCKRIHTVTLLRFCKRIHSVTLIRFCRSLLAMTLLRFCQRIHAFAMQHFCRRPYLYMQ